MTKLERNEKNVVVTSLARIAVTGLMTCGSFEGENVIFEEFNWAARSLFENMNIPLARIQEQAGHDALDYATALALYASERKKEILRRAMGFVYGLTKELPENCGIAQRFNEMFEKGGGYHFSKWSMLEGNQSPFVIYLENSIKASRPHITEAMKKALDDRSERLNFSND